MPPPSIELSGFLASIATRDQLRHVALPGFVRRRAMSSMGHTCPLCVQPYDRTHPRRFAYPVAATLVHPALGGPLSMDNAFTCCRRCQQQRSASDLIALGALPDALLAQRAAVLLCSHNHLLPLSTTTRPTDFIRALAQRHTLPRGRLFAAQGEDGLCFLGVPPRFGDGCSKWLARLLARQVGTVVHHANRVTVYQLDDAEFLRVVWKLIDANALIVALACRSQPRDFLDCWWPTSASPSTLRLRHVGFAVPPHTPHDYRPTKHIRTSRTQYLRERRGLVAELRDVARTADALRQAVNDQHKAHWLDGEERAADQDDALLGQLNITERQIEHLRNQLAITSRCRLSFP